MPVDLSCPLCRTAITTGADAAVCASGHRFLADDGVVDFVGGPPQDLGRAPDPDHCCEMEGMEKRVDRFIVPWIRERLNRDGVTVLEDGCGNGATVQLLVERGLDAYGIDPGRRTAEWKHRNLPGRLFVADGTNLPFPDESFDVVTSSGVLEHVGEPRPRREQFPFQRAYMTEVVRVLKPGGAALIAAPNGAFPIDFWHPRRWSVRPHLPYETWMPNAFEVDRWTKSSPHPVHVRYLSPEGYLAFDRVRAHWYGRVFSGGMQALFRTITRVPPLARGPLNPWLVAEIVRTG